LYRMCSLICKSTHLYKIDRYSPKDGSVPTVRTHFYIREHIYIECVLLYILILSKGWLASDGVRSICIECVLLYVL
jgi:hypothetical protein